MTKHALVFFIALLLSLGRLAHAQSLDELLAHADPFRTQPTLELQELVEKLIPLEHTASPEQKPVIDLFKMRYLAIRGDYTGSLALFYKLDIPTMPPDIRVRAYSIASIIYHIQGNYILAFQTLNKMQQLLPWIRDNDTLYFIALATVPELYMDSGDLNKALEYALLQKKAAQRTSDPMNICTSHDSLAGTYYKRNELEKSKIEYSQMLVDCSRISAVLFMGTAHNGIGMALEKQGRYQDAIQEFRQARKMFMKAGYQYGLGSSLVNQASSYFALGKSDLARDQLEQAMPLIESSRVYDFVIPAYDLKSRLAETEGNIRQALIWQRKKSASEKEALGKKKAMRLAQLQVEYEVKQQEQELKQLQQQNQLLALQKQTGHQRYLIIILGLLILALITVLFWIKAQRERRHFKHMSQVDPLTGLYNHAYCYSLAEKGFHECLNRSQPFTVVVADIDWFKYVNDTYGHAAGDKVLKHIATVLKNCLGINGIVGRTGGEEFTCFLPGMDLEQARTLVENCRRQVQPVVDYGKSVEVTLSYGLAQSLGRYKTLDTLVRDADEALYKAKRNGRNQVLTHTPVDRSGTY